MEEAALLRVDALCCAVVVQCGAVVLAARIRREEMWLLFLCKRVRWWCAGWLVGAGACCCVDEGVR
jgi:hypothetical protein